MKPSHARLSFLLAALLALLWLPSCDSYLDNELRSDTSVEFLYETEEGLESAVVGLYNLRRGLYGDPINESMMALIMQFRSDLAIPRAGAGSLIGRYVWGGGPSGFGTNNRVGRLWRHWYRIVDKSNAVIAATEELQDVEDAQRNQILAEARLFRAEAYFTLYRQFNNIFITTEPTSPGNVFDRPQDKSSEEEIFALIHSDLAFAIEHLPWTAEQFGRYTQAAARHVRAKTAMWQEDWATAKEQAEAVIDQGSYALVPSTGDVFVGDFNHSETLFAVLFADDQLGGGGRHLIHFNLVPNYGEIDGAELAISNGGRGVGFLLMNDYLLSLLEENPGDTRTQNTYYATAYTYNDADALPPDVSLGDTIDVHDQFSSNPDERVLYYQRLNPGCLKFLDEEAEPGDATGASNIMIYRLAETYLIAAEANMELGNTEQALSQINAVRARAATPLLAEIDLDRVLEERARELAFEGQRWYTLKRRGLLISYLRDHVGNDNFRNEVRDAVEPQHVNFPIPENELNLLGANYPQNEGY